MLGTRLPSDLENRLVNLASITGRTKSFYVREALEKHLDDIEDRYLALYRLENPEKIISMEEAEKELGLDS